MDIAHMGMESRIRYEVTIYKLSRGFEDLYDWEDTEGYRDGLKAAKKASTREGVTHTELVKNIEFYYPNDLETIWDTQVSKRWIFKAGKKTGEYEF